ncbi:MAG TPA: monovalent cation/H+ antiporter complex subunit F [Gammaproteobacteria bacterium]|nr:monovalent cation/H+ antiporter complex subunit F [Gammaproteobacteria bacterium]
MLPVITVAILVTMLLCLARAVLGPTVYDRILAINLFGSATVVIIAALGFLDGRPHWLDIALVYALINFVSTIAVLKFMENGGMGAGRRDRDAQGEP